MNRRSLIAGFIALIATRGRVQATTSDEYCLDDECARLLSIINQYRRDNGLGPLAISQTLGAAAQHHSLDMATTRTLSHTLSDGTTWSQNIVNHGYPYSGRGENIAWGLTTAEQAFGWWKNSPSHDANMLYPSFTVAGIARVMDTSGNAFWTNTFASRMDIPGVACSGVSPTPVVTVVSTATRIPTVTPTVGASSTPVPTATRKPCKNMGRWCR
jgi:hypothetical protein